MKPALNCTGFIFYEFPTDVNIKLYCVLQELLGTKETKSGDRKSIEKLEESSQGVEDVVQHRSTDDLRSGGFQYRMEGGKY